MYVQAHVRHLRRLLIWHSIVDSRENEALTTVRFLISVTIMSHFNFKHIPALAYLQIMPVYDEDF